MPCELGAHASLIIVGLQRVLRAVGSAADTEAVCVAVHKQQGHCWLKDEGKALSYYLLSPAWHITGV